MPGISVQMFAFGSATIAVAICNDLQKVLLTASGRRRCRGGGAQRSLVLVARVGGFNAVCLGIDLQHLRDDIGHLEVLGVGPDSGPGPRGCPAISEIYQESTVEQRAEVRLGVVQTVRHLLFGAGGPGQRQWASVL
jgi:hypothetical protein